MERILFSCVGTTDPARGAHDGGLMHIMRHYRPHAICLFLTPEMAALDRNDQRYQKLMDHVKAHWDGYCPELFRVTPPIQDASDLDELAQPLTQAASSFAAQYPQCELLVNLSSGTPQMKMILSQLLLDLRYRSRGIQVKNFEAKAGTSLRSNDRTYLVEEELSLSELEEGGPDAVNRCVEPALFALRREAQWQQIDALLHRRDYAAILKMGQPLSPPLMQLVAHLEARSNLKDKEAKAHLRGLSLGFELYPRKRGVGAGGDYGRVSEYFLMMKNFQVAGRYTDFVLRLNPLTIRLQETWLESLVQRYYHCSWEGLLLSRGNICLLSAVNLERALPGPTQAVNQMLLEQTGKPLQNTAPSIFIYHLFLQTITQQNAPRSSQEQAQVQFLLPFFAQCLALNTQYRNLAAHDLVQLTDDQIQQAIQMDSAKLVRKLEQALQLLYPQCDPALFQIYHKCNEYIRAHH